MKSILILCALIAIVYADRDAWNKYKKNHGRKYRDKKTEEKHFKNFKINDEKINKHNSQHDITYTMAHNELSVFSADEFKQMFLHEVDIIPKPSPRSLPVINPDSFPTGPENISYINYTLPVVDQGNCGACWAFSTSAQVETVLKRRNFTYNSPLSKQYLLDCSINKGCDGGGVPSNAFNFLKTNGLVAESNYPYTDIKETCKTTVPKMTEKINAVNHFDLFANEQQLANIVASVGPVVIAMFSTDSFQFYSTGIYYDPICPSNCITANHGMVVVGYGIDNSLGFPVGYWLVRNSWGTTWGENGYVRMVKGYSGLINNCNVACRIDYST